MQIRTRSRINDASARATKFCILLATLSCSVGNESLAQGTNRAELEEIVVTAQKREQNLQDVPISISTLSFQQIENADISSVQDIAEFMPSVQIQARTPDTQRYSIRGVLPGDPTGAGSDSSVVVFLDGLYLGRASAFLTDLYDVDRVEVLKGPQGTLSGRNVAGGAINVITQRPSDEFSAAAEVSAGNYKMTTLKARVNGALTDRIAASVSAVTRNRDGFFTRVPGLRSPFTDTPQNTGAVTSTNLRGQLAIDARENVDLRLIGSYSRFRQDGVAHKVYPAGTWLTSAPFNFQPHPDPWVTEGYIPGYANSDSYTASATLNWDTNIGTFTSISAYLDAHTDGGADTVSITEGIFRSFNSADETVKQYTQELRLASPSDGRKLGWLGGVYLYRADVEHLEFWDRDLLGATSNPIYDQDNVTTSVAGFTTVSYDLSDAWRVTAGVRQTHDRKRMRNTLTDGLNGTSTNGLAPALSAYSVDVSDDWSSTTPSLNIQFSPRDELMLYATYSEGFKAGEFQGIAPEIVAATTSVAPEEVKSTELGLKSRWLSDRLQLNISAFSMDYKDMQLPLRILTDPNDQASAVRVLFNASDAEIRGLELDARAIPFDGLSLAFFYSYLDTELVDFNPGVGGGDLSGNEMLAPNNAFTVTATYTLDMGNGAELDLYADHRYTGERYWSFANSEVASEPAYGVTNARVTYRTASEWSFSLWGYNLSDTLYRLSTTTVVDTGLGTSFGAPRTYGLTLSRAF